MPIHAGHSWPVSLQWRHNGHDGVSNHQPPRCLLNRLFGLRSNLRKHQSSASLAFVRWIHRWPVNSPHKWPVTRKMFPFVDFIMSLEFVLMMLTFAMLPCSVTRAMPSRPSTNIWPRSPPACSSSAVGAHCRQPPWPGQHPTSDSCRSVVSAKSWRRCNFDLLFWY